MLTDKNHGAAAGGTPAAVSLSLPLWARAADYLAMTLGSLAVLSWALGGGSFRVVSGAVAIGMWRHAFVLDPPIYRHFGVALRRR